MEIKKFTIVDIDGKHPGVAFPIMTKHGLVLFYRNAPERTPFTQMDPKGFLETGMLDLEHGKLVKETIRAVPRLKGSGHCPGLCRIADDKLLLTDALYHIYHWLGEVSVNIIPAHEWAVASMGVNSMIALETEDKLMFGKPRPVRVSGYPFINGYGPPLFDNGAVYYAGDFNSDVTALSDKPWETILVSSSDAGETWEFESMICMENKDSEIPKLQKPWVAQTGPESLLCVMMSQTESADLYFIRSSDMGKTWSEAAPTGVAGSWHSLLTLKDGRIMMAYAPVDNYKSVCVIFSEDGGKTWPEESKALVDDRAGVACHACPKLLHLDDGSILLTYVTSLSGDKSRQIAGAIINL